VFFYPFFAVAPILLATHRWPGTGQFFRDLAYNRNGFWNALVRPSRACVRCACAVVCAVCVRVRVRWCVRCACVCEPDGECGGGRR
jgi:hypothetical protein